jgi:hypothetical protein
MDNEVPDAIHTNAGDLACEDDRIWFDRNSSRDYRLREIVPHELDGLSAPPQGTVWKVLVAQINHEIRVRTPVAHSLEFTDDADDDYLGQIFKITAPKNVLKVAKAAKRLAETK